MTIIYRVKFLTQKVKQQIELYNIKTYSVVNIMLTVPSMVC
ncbi:hypothetical protein SAMN05421846_105167 [Chryseobacterium taeanense]|uniref:Uncharacterized protein n=1 Tax=Chryseobacterium taeanense TaxID=311334 RepID=A0A1G8IZT8_9FLAO|nr:hypothetical protein SAMN05421846_105167 [Chryseobacterium taeanense]